MVDRAVAIQLIYIHVYITRLQTPTACYRASNSSKPTEDLPFACQALNHFKKNAEKNGNIVKINNWRSILWW